MACIKDVLANYQTRKSRLGLDQGVFSRHEECKEHSEKLLNQTEEEAGMKQLRASTPISLAQVTKVDRELCSGKVTGVNLSHPEMLKFLDVVRL